MVDVIPHFSNEWSAKTVLSDQIKTTVSQEHDVLSVTALDCTYVSTLPFFHGYILSSIPWGLRDLSPSVKVKVKIVQSCPTLWDPMECILPFFSFHGILQERILVWVAFHFPSRSSWPRDQTRVSCTAGRFSTVWTTREAQEVSKVTSSALKVCPTSGPPGNAFHGCTLKYLLANHGTNTIWRPLYKISSLKSSKL